MSNQKGTVRLSFKVIFHAVLMASGPGLIWGCQSSLETLNPPVHLGLSSAFSGTGGSAIGFEAFKSGFYAFTQTQGCVKCHASIVTPKFAAADPNEAYAQASGFQIGSSTAKLIDFANPAASIIIVYAGNNHCADVPCSNPLVRPAVQNLLTIWSDAETGAQNTDRGGIGEAPNYLTGALPVPTNLPSLTVATPGVLRFPLSQLKPAVAGLENAILEIEAQMINPSEYRLSRPKIAGNTKALTFSGLHVYIKVAGDSGLGAEDTKQTSNWYSTSSTAAIFALPNPLPKTPLAAVPLNTLAIYVQSLSTTDVFTIGIEDIH